MNKEEYGGKIVNGKLEPLNPEKKIGKDKMGLPVEIDDYGMGAIHWPVVPKYMTLETRQMLANVLWAVERFPYALTQDEKSLEECVRTILSGGAARKVTFIKSDNTNE